MSANPRGTDAAFAWALILLAVAFGARVLLRGATRLGNVPLTLGACAALVLAGACLLVFDRAPGRRLLGLGLRSAVYGGVLLTVAYVVVRVAGVLAAIEPAPPRQLRPGEALETLGGDNRLRWAVRVASQAVAAAPRVDSILTIPIDWPFPDGVDLLAVVGEDSAWVAATDPGSGRACRLVLFGRAVPLAVAARRHDPIECGRLGDVHPRGSRALFVQRGALRSMTGGVDVSLSDDEGWRQYRHDANRTGTTSHTGRRVTPWRVLVDGEIRATPSSVKQTILIGTHGVGALTAVDAASGRLLWRRYVPNWIHHDAISDGRVVLVGFGDSDDSMYGRTPAGMSAFSLASGGLMWSAFEESSVMTSPVIWGGYAVYATGMGLLKVRELRTGKETARVQLPGRVIMAPPAVHGDTLVVALDPDEVCAVQLPSLRTLWCRALGAVDLVGHSALSVIGGHVYASGLVKQNGAPTRFGMAPVKWRELLAVFGLERLDRPFWAGQQVWSLGLDSGQVEWHSKVYPAMHDPVGHVSGTMTSGGGVGIAVLPVAGRTVAFDLATGRELWSATSGTSRGPALVSDDRVTLTLESGELRVVELRTGRTQCSISTSASFDRAGPILVDSMLIFGTRSGLLVALPQATLDACAAAAVRELVR